MNKSIISKLMIGLLLFFMSLNKVVAETTFKITEGDVSATVKAHMEVNVTALLNAFHQAAECGEKNIKISKDYASKTAIDEIKEMWKSSAMSCPPMNINCRCLKTSNGYQVRGIPVDMIEAAEDEARQELTISFDEAGTITNVAIAIEMNRYEELMAEKQS